MANIVLENIAGQRRVSGEMNTGYNWVTGILSPCLQCDTILSRNRKAFFVVGLFLVTDIQHIQNILVLESVFIQCIMAREGWCTAAENKGLAQSSKGQLSIGNWAQPAWNRTHHSAFSISNLVSHTLWTTALNIFCRLSCIR